MSKLLRVLTGLFLVIALVVGCSSGSGSSGSSVTPPTPAPPTTSTITGIAANSAIHGADIRIFQFGPDGSLVEVTAVNAPVKTSADGSFVAEITVSDLFAGGGPLVITTTGGTMNAEAAPRFAAVVADSSSLSKAGSSIEQYLTVPTSVAAELLQRDAIAAGDAPLPAAANSIIARVEAGLGVSLSENPMIDGTSLAFFNNSIDANLNLIEMPQNNPAVDDLIDYFVMNFNCASGQLDRAMVNPADPTDRTYPATFEGVGSGTLANILPGGPESLLVLTASIDKERIENDGFETATLTVSFMNGVGEPGGDGMRAGVEATAGRLVISKNNPLITNGQAVAYVSSVWAGEAQVTVDMTLPVGTTAAESFDLVVVDDVADVEDTEHPHVVSAGSTGNTEVLVSFSEAMLGGIESAENPGHYRIVATESLAEASKKTRDNTVQKPEIMVSDAELILPDRHTVRLTTFSQSDLQYELTVINMTDLAGNSMAQPGRLVEPSKTVFQGTPPSGSQVVDTDGDGLSDTDEQRGWVVTSVTSAGVVLTLEVTSDPTNADTDGDGISDSDEFHGGMNPRTADTDGDTLTDYQEWRVIHSDALNQDTDGDGIEDGYEFYTFRTSPILADTDGDQLSDPEEIAAGNRNPLIADLPSPRISIGNVNLQLDTRFRFTSATGESVTDVQTFDSTIRRGEDETYSTSNQNSTKKTLAFSEELQTKVNLGLKAAFEGATITAKVGSKQGSERGNTFTVGEESRKSSEETYHDSLSTTIARDVRETLTREILGAAMKVDVSIDNVGDLPFTISNLELSAQVQDPLDRRRMIPVAALVPENQGLGSVNIGALGDPSRGPFVFNTVSVFPQQVQELMKNPRGLVVQLANFDITDNEGNNFAFTSQEVLDRTAGITFDLGDGRVENYRVATASTHDPSTGRPTGITMAYVFDIIGLHRHATIRDGGNGIVETTAAGDDESVFAVGSTIEPGSVIIEAGGDGVLTSAAQGDDEWVQPDYETTLQRDFASIRDGGNGIAETTAVGDDVQQIAVGSIVFPGQVIVTVGTNAELDTTILGGDDLLVPASVPDHRVLTRFRDVKVNKDTKRFWALFLSTSRSGVDLEKYIVRAGEQFDFTYVQDKDDDGVWAREEFMHGSSDLLPNTDGCDRNPAPDPCDTLTDKEEIQEGWRVRLHGSPQGFRVYPNPVQADSDRDGLTDDVEKACGLDPRQRDTDLDGLTDREELKAIRIVEGVDTPMTSRDYYTYEVKLTVEPYGGLDENMESQETLEPWGIFSHADIFDEACNGGNFGTDPLNADTDGDLVDDAVELIVGLNPNDPSDGPTYLDDDGDGLSNFVEETGYYWDRYVNTELTKFTSNPNAADTDGDRLPDLLEWFIGSNPQSIDTDGDGIADYDEYAIDGMARVTLEVGGNCDNDNPPPWVFFNKRIDEFSYLEYLKRCSAAAVCDNAAIEGDLASIGAANEGTNPSERDTDFDGLNDNYEITEHDIIVDGVVRPVTSLPHTCNSDEDGWHDGLEDCYPHPVNIGTCYSRTDPKDPNTDGDNLNDNFEPALGRDPTVPDKRIRVVLDDAIVVYGDNDYISPDITVWSSFEDSEFEQVSRLYAWNSDDDASFTLSDYFCAVNPLGQRMVPGLPQTIFNGVLGKNSRLEIKFTGFEWDNNHAWLCDANRTMFEPGGGGNDIFHDVTETITFDSPGSTGEIKVDTTMKEVAGDENEVKMQMTISEILLSQ